MFTMFEKSILLLLREEATEWSYAVWKDGRRSTGIRMSGGNLHPLLATIDT